jgi:hypothetical protein
LNKCEAETTKAYLEGFEAASRPQPANCPYPADTIEAEAWWSGFGDWLDAHDANQSA